jgi:hypothetical protein
MFGFRCCWMKRFKNVLVRPIRDVSWLSIKINTARTFSVLVVLSRLSTLMKNVLFMVSDIWNMNYNPSNNSNLVNFIWFVTILSMSNHIHHQMFDWLIFKRQNHCEIQNSWSMKIIELRLSKCLRILILKICRENYWEIMKSWTFNVLFLLTHKCARCLGFEGLKPACRRSIQRTALNLNRFHRGRPCAWSFFARC